MADFKGELHRGGQVTLDGSGNGTVTLMSDHANQRWEVRHVSVQTSQAATATPIPVCTFLVNGAFRGATKSGSNDIWDGLIRVGPCDQFAVAFTGGIPGTTATAAVEGDYFTRRG